MLCESEACHPCWELPCCYSSCICEADYHDDSADGRDAGGHQDLDHEFYDQQDDENHEREYPAE